MYCVKILLLLINPCKPKTVHYVVNYNKSGLVIGGTAIVCVSCLWCIFSSHKNILENWPFGEGGNSLVQCYQSFNTYRYTVNPNYSVSVTMILVATSLFLFVYVNVTGPQVWGNAGTTCVNWNAVRIRTCELLTWPLPGTSVNWQLSHSRFCIACYKKTNQAKFS